MSLFKILLNIQIVNVFLFISINFFSSSVRIQPHTIHTFVKYSWGMVSYLFLLLFLNLNKQIWFDWKANWTVLIKNTTINRTTATSHTRFPHSTSTSLLNGYNHPTPPPTLAVTPLTNSPGHPWHTYTLLPMLHTITALYRNIVK